MTAPPTSVPLVSVVMPFKDAAGFLDEAVASVLGQTWSPLELVLVDDGGSDGSDHLAARLADGDSRVRVVSHEGRTNRGIGPSRALGIRQARGGLVAFLDADDVWEPSHLADDVRLLLDHPDADMVCGRVWEWRSWAAPGPADTLSGLAFAPGAVMPGVRLLAAVLRHGGLATATCALLARRDLLLDCLDHLDRFPGMYEDQAMNSALQLRGTVVMSGATSAWYRQHSTSFSARDAARAERHDSGRTVFLTWLREEVDRRPDPDPEVSRLLEQALTEVDRYLTEPPGTHGSLGLQDLLPPVARRVLRGLRRRVVAQSGAPAAEAARPGRLAPLLSRHGADVRGDVLVLGADTRSAADVAPHGEHRPWPDEPVTSGPHTVWARLTTAAWDCIVALPAGSDATLGRAQMRHLRRALRPGGVLLVTGKRTESRVLSELHAVFGWEAVSVDLQADPGPRDIPLLLYRAVIPAA